MKEDFWGKIPAEDLDSMVGRSDCYELHYYFVYTNDDAMIQETKIEYKQYFV